jgi:hypothetical protein
MSDLRLDGCAPATHGGATLRTRHCLECREPYASRRVKAEFCGDRCRKLWNNRRMTRGAEIYDLFMALRFDRGIATALHVFTLVSRLARVFRDDDMARRDGRRSWQRPRSVIEHRPSLNSVIINSNAAGRRRK